MNERISFIKSKAGEMSSSLHQINPLQLGCNGIDWWERWSCSAARSKLFSFSSQSNQSKIDWFDGREEKLIYFFSSSSLFSFQPAEEKSLIVFVEWSSWRQPHSTNQTYSLFSRLKAGEAQREEEVNGRRELVCCCRPAAAHNPPPRHPQRVAERAGGGKGPRRGQHKPTRRTAAAASCCWTVLLFRKERN